MYTCKQVAKKFDCSGKTIRKWAGILFEREYPCWLFSETRCRNEIRDKYLEKIEICLGCKVLRTNMDISSIENTLKVASRHIKKFRKLVESSDVELRNIGMELARDN